MIPIVSFNNAFFESRIALASFDLVLHIVICLFADLSCRVSPK